MPNTCPRRATELLVVQRYVEALPRGMPQEFGLTPHIFGHRKKYKPLLLPPICFGIFIVNFPLSSEIDLLDAICYVTLDSSCFAKDRVIGMAGVLN